MPTVEESFRRLTIGDSAILDAMSVSGPDAPGLRHPDARTEALLRIAALIAIDAPPTSYTVVVAAALRACARLEDLLAVLTAVVGTVGSARVISAAPRIALAAGYDVEAALE